MSEDVSTSAPETVTLDELIDLSSAASPDDVEIHVLLDLGYDQPYSLPVKGLHATIYRSGRVVLVLDAT